MQRVGYDADTQQYSYRDQDGSYWEGAPGARYGVLHRSKKNPLEQTRSKLTAFHLGGSSYQPMTIANVGVTREELPSSANRPHKQLFGLLSNGCGKLLVTLDLIYTGIFKKVSHAKQQPQRHTQRRRRRPHKWHEK
jgi:hypothetical protein